MDIIKSLRDDGKTIILITHKLEEIKRIADRCAILNHGRLMDVMDVATTSTKVMANKMVGREVNFETEKEPAKPGKTILSIEKLNVYNKQDFQVVKDVSLEVHSGEIVAIAGVAGNGQVEIADAIAGLVPVRSGKILLNGRDITNLSIRERTTEGISYIPEDRQNYGLVMDFTLSENLALRNYYKEPFCHKGVLDQKIFEDNSEKLIEKYDIRSGQGSKTVVRSMSGGNQQKAIIAREVEQDSSLMIFVQPTRGLDIGAIENIHKQIIAERDKGKAILLISLELDEIMNCADTIAVIYNGSIQKIAKASELTTNEVAGGVIIAVTGSNPFKAYYALLQGGGLAPKSSYASYKSMLTDFMSYVNYFTPMIFAALAVAVALRAGLFNIGVSGQMLAAGFTASIVVGYSSLNAVLAKPLVVIIGLIVGGLVGALIGFLKYRFNINEVVSSIMLNYTFQYVISFFINTFFVDPVSRQSKEISAASRLTLMDTMVGNLKMDIPLGIILALLTVVAVWFLLEKTKLGYELKAVGYSRSAAKYAGIKVGRSMVLSMTISGALAGLAGVTYYLGYVGSIQPKVLISTGFDAIAVSLLGNNNPFGIVFSTMLITLISKGSTYMKSAAGVDAEIASVITGIILLFSACNAYIKWKMERNRREKTNKTKEDK